MSGHILFKVKVMEPAADSRYMVEDYTWTSIILCVINNKELNGTRYFSATG
ncbi:MAG: hypothetical protein J6A03_08260 [Lachnospiraceae bacterium]|nr:hypothetical protein [Lachnospiraceae bacterium]